MGRGKKTWALGSAAAAVLGTLAGACLPGSGPPLQPYKDDAGSPPPTSLGDDASNFLDVDLGDPFAVTGLNPAHGPWTGGTHVDVHGRGFPSNLRIFVGGVEIPSANVLATDPTHAAATTPPGTPGPADVTVLDDGNGQERTLPAGFFYDAFDVEPSSGSTTGGTRITLTGSGTAWKAGTTVAVDGKPCTTVAVTDAQHLACSTPPDTTGAKDVTVTDPDGTFAQASDAFTYSDSPDGYRGGLAGGALAGNLEVLAFDGFVGTPIAGAHVIVGGQLASALVQATDASGIAQFSDPSLTGSVTVTVAAKCHQPITFVGDPVDNVTVYLTPVLDPSCAAGDPPSSGAYVGVDGGLIQGELVWPGSYEFKRSAWTNVPQPTRSTERQAAYVFTADGVPYDTFQLPPASAAITPSSSGTLGYAYSIPAYPGNATVYALAGIEDRSVTPPTFVPYAMGVVSGVGVAPSTETTGVDISMTTLLDHEVTLAPRPPAVSPAGPDRLVSTASVTLGADAYAILPQGTQTTLLPMSGNVVFAPVPALDGTLAGQSYVLSAEAVTGPNLGMPVSVVSRIQTTDSNDPIAVGGFLGVPVLDEPATGTWSGTHASVEVTGQPDLLVMVVASGGGLVDWTIAAPGPTASFDLPDLGTFPDGVGLVHGAITTTVYVAAINGFDYGALRYGQLGPSAWNAYAADARTGAY
jgi:IPT/TIG domain-containing protein